MLQNGSLLSSILWLKCSLKSSTAFSFSLIVKLISVPLLSSEFSSISPPNSLINFCVIVSPSPVPFMLNWSLYLLTVPNTWNKPFVSDSEMPSPVSETVTFRYREFRKVSWLWVILITRVIAARRIYPPITPPVRGVYKPKKMTKFFKLVYPPYPPKTTAINNLIRKYFFMRSYLNIIPFIFYAFVMFNSQYSILNL